MPDWFAVPELLTIAVILGAFTLGALTKGIAGVGLPLLAIPVMAAFLGVEEAVIIMIIPTIVSNGWMAWIYRAEIPWLRRLVPLYLTAAVGAVIGTFALSALDPLALEALLALMLAAYLALRLGKAEFELNEIWAMRLRPIVGLFGGISMGATGIAAPVLATYLHACRIPRKRFIIASVVAYFFISSSQFVSIWQLGLLTEMRLAQGLIALIPVFLVMPIGVMIGKRVSAQTFDKIILGLLTLIEVRLLWDVGSAWV